MKSALASSFYDTGEIVLLAVRRQQTEIFIPETGVQAGYFLIFPRNPEKYKPNSMPEALILHVQVLLFFKKRLFFAERSFLGFSRRGISL